MSNLFTAVSVDQQEIVAGGYEIIKDNYGNIVQSNGAYLEIKDSNDNFIEFKQKNVAKIIAKRRSWRVK